MPTRKNEGVAGIAAGGRDDLASGARRLVADRGPCRVAHQLIATVNKAHQDEYADERKHRVADDSRVVEEATSRGAGDSGDALANGKAGAHRAKDDQAPRVGPVWDCPREWIIVADQTQGAAANEQEHDCEGPEKEANKDDVYASEAPEAVLQVICSAGLVGPPQRAVWLS
jgi:hypothetical protein